MPSDNAFLACSVFFYFPRECAFVKSCLAYPSHYAGLVNDRSFSQCNGIVQAASVCSFLCEAFRAWRLLYTTEPVRRSWRPPPRQRALPSAAVARRPAAHVPQTQRPVRGARDDVGRVWDADQRRVHAVRVAVQQRLELQPAAGDGAALALVPALALALALAFAFALSRCNSIIWHHSPIQIESKR